jgi:hypothetical protein
VANPTRSLRHRLHPPAPAPGPSRQPPTGRLVPQRASLMAPNAALHATGGRRLHPCSALAARKQSLAAAASSPGAACRPRASQPHHPAVQAAVAAAAAAAAAMVVTPLAAAPEARGSRRALQACGRRFKQPRPWPRCAHTRRRRPAATPRQGCSRQPGQGAWQVHVWKGRQTTRRGSSHPCSDSTRACCGVRGQPPRQHRGRKPRRPRRSVATWPPAQSTSVNRLRAHQKHPRLVRSCGRSRAQRRHLLQLRDGARPSRLRRRQGLATLGSSRTPSPTLTSAWRRCAREARQRRDLVPYQHLPPRRPRPGAAALRATANPSLQRPCQGRWRRRRRVLSPAWGPGAARTSQRRSRTSTLLAAAARTPTRHRGCRPCSRAAAARCCQKRCRARRTAHRRGRPSCHRPTVGPTTPSRNSPIHGGSCSRSRQPHGPPLRLRGGARQLAPAGYPRARCR